MAHMVNVLKLLLQNQSDLGLPVVLGFGQETSQPLFQIQKIYHTGSENHMNFLCGVILSLI